MNLWSLLGVSVAVTALFSIGVMELGRSREFYETYRWFVIAGFGWLGVILYIVGRIKNVRLSRAIRDMHARGQTEINGKTPEKPFFFFSMSYWGVMFLVFGLIILILAPPPGEPVAAATNNSKPSKAAPSRAAPQGADPLDGLKMQGVVYRKPNPSVIINGRTYYVGDSIGGVKVLAIHAASVDVEHQGRTRTLKLED